MIGAVYVLPICAFNQMQGLFRLGVRARPIPDALQADESCCNVRHLERTIAC
jgi:hypothetical protein